MDTNKMREQFEAAFIAQQVAAFGEYTRRDAVHRLKRDGEFDKPPTPYDLHRREKGMYDEYWTEMLWWAWQASREAVVVELPNRAAEAYREEFDDVEGGSFDEAAYIRDVRKAIEAQGLKVKP